MQVKRKRLQKSLLGSKLAEIFFFKLKPQQKFALIKHHSAIAINKHFLIKHLLQRMG